MKKYVTIGKTMELAHKSRFDSENHYFLAYMCLVFEIKIISGILF